jgi:hypothetical protein
LLNKVQLCGSFHTGLLYPIYSFHRLFFNTPHPSAGAEEGALIIVIIM